MAKELPYFKFEPGEWETGNIQMCNTDSKSLFIDICCMYWNRLGELPYALALQKLCRGNENEMDELKKYDIIMIQNDNIIIEFLDEQLDKFQETSKKRVEAANKRWNSANEMQMHNKSNAIREEKIKEENNIDTPVLSAERKASNDKYPFEDFWNIYGKKVSLKACKSKWKNITQKDKQKIFEVVDKYVKSTPEIEYRKNPLTWLNQECWNDEIIINEKQLSWADKRKAEWPKYLRKEITDHNEITPYDVICDLSNTKTKQEFTSWLFYYVPDHERSHVIIKFREKYNRLNEEKNAQVTN